MADSKQARAENRPGADSELVVVSLEWLEALSPDDLFPLIPRTLLNERTRAACLLLAASGEPPFRAVAQAGATRAAAQEIALALNGRPPLSDQNECYDLPIATPAFSTGEDRVDVHLLRLQGMLLGALAVVVPRRSSALALPWLVVRHAAIAVSNALQFEDLCTRSEGLSAIAQLESSVGLEVAFENVVARIITRLPTLLGATKAGVLLYDPHTQKLRLQAPAFGFFEGEMVEKYQVTVDTGGAAWGVFSSGKAYLGNDCFSDPCCRQEIISLFGLSKMICVPLARAGKRIGVVIVANRFDRDFTQEDVEILEILSSHIGATLENARLMEEETRRTAELERLHAVTKEQHDELQRILEAHLELNQRALAGTGIPGVGERLFRLIKRPVSVLDHFGALVYRSPCSAEEAEALADAEQRAGERDIRTGGPASAAEVGSAVADTSPAVPSPSAPRHGALRTVVADITGGDQHLGCLVVLGGDEGISRSEATTIAYARSMFALEMLKQRAVLEVERRLQGEFITDLLAGSADAASLTDRGYRFGHDLSRPHWVVAILPAEDSFAGPAGAPERPGDGVAAASTALDGIERSLARLLPGSAIYPRGRGMVLLLSAEKERSEYHPPSLAAVHEELERQLGGRLLVGIGSLCTRVADYPRSWREAELSVELGSRVTPGRSEFTFRDLGVYRLLSNVEDPEVLQAFHDDALGPLIQHDRQHNDRLLPTLAGFLASGGVLKAAAARLAVHENTLRHRLDRIQHILGVDLSRTATRTELDLALKIHGTGRNAG